MVEPTSFCVTTMRFNRPDAGSVGTVVAGVDGEGLEGVVGSGAEEAPEVLVRPRSEK